ncbi:DUF6520 family protein [Flavobacterium yafengii]|uniref:DUF6520 family protein n=1 Tax=Flavobacterium yafengii TaxID=3041253 RepID=UPI0024A87208|nr:DUF6520 family protein [Flavobacterium yafengii]MDI5887611.1 DUF6520 family protein [Flavobacterium yafengii]
MKTPFLKKMMPLAVFVLGISGAVLTTSMQSDATVAKAPVLGYINGPDGPCSIPVDCSDTGGQFCRVNGTTGTQAFGKDSETTCLEVLYRPGS